MLERISDILHFIQRIFWFLATNNSLVFLFSYHCCSKVKFGTRLIYKMDIVCVCYVQVLIPFFCMTKKMLLVIFFFNFTQNAINFLFDIDSFHAFKRYDQFIILLFILYWNWFWQQMVRNKLSIPTKTLKLRLSLFCIESVLIIQRKTEQIRVSKNKQQNLKIEIF